MEATANDIEIRETEKRVREYFLQIQRAENQARVDFATRLREERVKWSSDKIERLNALVEAFTPEKIYGTVYRAVAQSLEDGNSCIMAEFSIRDYGELALHAAHEAAQRVRDTGEYKAQVRRYGDRRVVKLLDI